MTEEEYKINLNQLNVIFVWVQRAVEGKFADQTYIDRSIHALSEPHTVNVSAIEAKVERPEAEALRPTLEALKNRKRERINSPEDYYFNKIWWLYMIFALIFSSFHSLASYTYS